ncbi:MAG: BamA/TamA family outer membrane protein [Bacteroidetes bacterium]|nr:BamA/TamA family outer membrane protein [Bacteroidota bacterium]
MRCCLIALLSFWLLFASHPCVLAQQERNYNRFQYHKYQWKASHTPAFHIYFPQGNDSLCAYVAEQLPETIKRVKHNMGTNLLRIPNIVIYPSVDQLYESNIGLYETEGHTLPTFIVKGTRLVLFYHGNYTVLRKQLYEGIAREIWESQLKEGLAAQAQGQASNEDIPHWYKEGAILFFAEQWPIGAEDELRRSWQHQRFQNWEQSIAHQPKLSGQAFCYFLTQQYYPLAAMQLYSQLKKRRTLTRAIRLITKHSLDTVMVQCHRFYANRFIENNGSTISRSIDPKINTTTIPHKKGIIRDVQVNATGSEIAYTVYSNKARIVYLYHVLSGKTDKLTSYKLPPWINDYSEDPYPILQWNKDGNELSIVKPVKGKISLLSFIYAGGLMQQNAIKNADGVGSIYQQGTEDYLLSAYRKGQSDIVSYNLDRETYTVHTNDRYDDSYPAQMSSPDEIFFISNRKPEEPTADQKRSISFRDTSKWKQGIYQLKGKEISPLYIDSIPYGKWDKLTELDPNSLLATHTFYGTERFAIVNKNQTGYQTLGNYQPIQFHESSSEIFTWSNDPDSISITRQPLNQWIETNRNKDTTSPWLEDYRKDAERKAKEDSLLQAARDQPATFIDELLTPKDAQERSAKRNDSIARSLSYDPKKVKPYILQLHCAYFTAKVNNDYFINRYQPYKNYQGQFKFPELGGMVQGGFTDLLEDHHVNIAFRLPAATEGSMFFMRYENTAGKTDWSIAYYRNVESLNPDPLRNWTDESGKPYPNVAKVKTHYGELSLHHPITYYLSADVTEAIRYDRTVFLATDRYSLKFEDLHSLWSITTLSMNYNKLQTTLPHLHKGYKVKLLLDVFQPLDESAGPMLGSTMQLRYDLPVYKYITWVTQLQVGRSFGRSHIQYNLAGLDNNVTVKVDSNAHAAQNAPYAFQTLITPFRGYLQNDVYGNYYGVWNNDVYFPLFQTLIPIETSLSFINQLQPGLFADIGKAGETWADKSTNPNNNNWLWSYGASLRSSLAGYPLRLDVAWPGTFNKKPMWYFTLSLR